MGWVGLVDAAAGTGGERGKGAKRGKGTRRKGATLAHIQNADESSRRNQFKPTLAAFDRSTTPGTTTQTQRVRSLEQPGTAEKVPKFHQWLAQTNNPTYACLPVIASRRE